MNRDDIIRMVREVYGDDKDKPFHESALYHLERFAVLVAAAEREECAKVCDELASYSKYECAKAIRARGNVKEEI